MSRGVVKIRNVGPKSAAWLRQVGVRTHEDLVRIGPVEAFLKIKRAGFRPSLNLLYSMAGALDDCHWTDLSEERRSALILELEAAESVNPIKSRWDKAADRSARNDGDAGVPAQEIDDGDGFGDGDSGVRELTGTASDFD
ncbi:MAG TPA: TfoX/Sxy family protein [Dokdonella sp.]|uniref:TfoX/Sxy family protein n=1 Tax=Dokdonella sp. TaxID=2291710 RepID=UPI0025C6569F|nr:TfoX/Sxy family protein [Dokdonella sp.]MBX3691638.1 TfoX/Sxy family protein [Dokdonella sp.]MCW5568958.1 TfoX/Sxy family protein [Dokdonella sp.]HNR91716.1 TfoX/Sxy family protein [Dokdonella sp.]